MPIETSVTDYGYRSKFPALTSVEEDKAWFEDVKRAIAGRDSFGQLLDLRGQRAQNDEIGAEIQERMAFLVSAGLCSSRV